MDLNDVQGVMHMFKDRVMTTSCGEWFVDIILSNHLPKGYASRASLLRSSGTTRINSFRCNAKTCMISCSESYPARHPRGEMDHMQGGAKNLRRS